MTSFHNITKTEMESLLVPQDFKIMVLPNTTELVYGKIIKKNGHKISLRVYTAINPSGESRECGADAVRIIPYVMYDKHPLPVCKSQTIRRIQTWAKNLQKGILLVVTQWSNDKARTVRFGVVLLGSKQNAIASRKLHNLLYRNLLLKQVCMIV